MNPPHTYPKSPNFSLVLVLLFPICLLSCAAPKTHTIFLQYRQPEAHTSVSSLTVGLAPFQDLRSSPKSLGERIRPDGKTEPIVLGTPAPYEDLTLIVRRYLQDHGIRVVDLLSWTPDPQTLGELPEEIQVAILGKIDDLEVHAESTIVKTMVQYRVLLSAHMGIKEKGEVITRKIEVSPRTTLLGFRAEEIEKELNDALAEAVNRLFEGLLIEKPQAQ